MAYQGVSAKDRKRQEWLKVRHPNTPIRFSSPDQEAIKEALTNLGRRVKDYSISKQENGYKLEAVLHVPKKEYGVNLINTLSSIPGVQLESFD